MHAFSKTKHGPGKRMHGLQKTVHGPEQTKQRPGEKEFTFPRKQLPNASRSRVFGKKPQAIGLGGVTLRISEPAPPTIDMELNRNCGLR
jgi:hypothetical protein